MRHLVLRSLLLTSVLVLIALGQGAVTPVLGANCGDGVGLCSCGDTVVTSTRLDGSHPVLQAPCPCDGLIVRSGVTLQIGGTLKGQNECSGIRVEPEPVSGRAEGVVVTDGRIVGFSSGVEFISFFNRLRESRFTHLQILDSRFFGIRLFGDDNLIEHNVIRRAGLAGMNIDAGDRNHVRLNRVEANNQGIFLSGDDNLIERNVVLRATFGVEIRGDQNLVSLNRVEDGDNAMIVQGDQNIVSRNIARRNGSFGFSIFGNDTTVDRNLSNDNGLGGFQVGGMNHEVTRNIAERNFSDGFMVRGDTSTFMRNISNHNGSFGISELVIGTSTNTYIDNGCTGNSNGDSSPPGLCF